MINPYLRNTTADYITGLVSACEGIKDSLVLLNGPLGCRFYHGYASGQSLLKASELWGLRGELRLENAMEDALIRSQYFAGTPQIPGTNQRYEDYIFGTREQLNRALNDILTERKYSLLAVIQTPGTSLLGEGLEGDLDKISGEFHIPFLFFENPQFSEDPCRGYDDAMVRLLELLVPASKCQKKSGGKPKVNLFGFHTYEKYLEGDVAEAERLLALCGIDVGCVAGANCTLESFQSISDGDVNVVFSPERCRKTERFLRKHYNSPVFCTSEMPVGPDLTEKWLREISALLHTDCGPALLEIQRTRARMFYYIARFMGGQGFPGDLRYAAEGECSLLCGYVDFLSNYLGIRPVCIHPLYASNEEERERLTEMLRQIGAEQVLDFDIMQVRDSILLGNANTILAVTAYSKNIYGIETAYPSSGYIHVTPKTHIGCAGALYLLEQILNGVRLLRAWR